ncbi:phosphotyrosine protein phosphatases superfamily protein [Actinidia rufa]|uniref:Phosphotyrosine protein phosphatases superfamily protein n=1 Tax=Actinidia rufa TaxID=165716 RepID=A0A7J0F279_9ERIC|nr:phosphotyrosine protein phosphatases superfamily protein [Actinidia rufa]
MTFATSGLVPRSFGGRPICFYCGDIGHIKSGDLRFHLELKGKLSKRKGNGPPRTATIADTFPGHVSDLSHIQSQLGLGPIVVSAGVSLLQQHPLGCTATLATDTSPSHVLDLSHIQSQFGLLQSQLGSLLQRQPSGSTATLATGTLFLGSDVATIPANLDGLPHPIPLFESPRYRPGGKTLRKDGARPSSVFGVLMGIGWMPIYDATIEKNASCGKTTYVHCKAGRGRSTTIVLCYLVEHKQMTPDAAYEYVRSIRPRVQLASSQWQAVQDYYSHKVKRPGSYMCTEPATGETVGFSVKHDLAAFDDGSVVVVTESDLDGYDDSSLVGNETLAELSLTCRVQFASQAAIAKLSCLWLRYHDQKLSRKKLGSSVSSDQIGSIGVDIRVC